MSSAEDLVQLRAAAVSALEVKAAKDALGRYRDTEAHRRACERYQTTACDLREALEDLWEDVAKADRQLNKEKLYELRKAVRDAEARHASTTRELATARREFNACIDN